MKYKNIREEELKNKVGVDYFKLFDTTEILGNIDFTVFPKQDNRRYASTFTPRVERVGIVRSTVLTRSWRFAISG